MGKKERSSTPLFLLCSLISSARTQSPFPDKPARWKVSSALSRDTLSFASRERSQGRSPKRAFIVRPLTPRTARHHSVQTKRGFVLFRIPFPLSTKARSFEIPSGKLANFTNHVSDVRLQTMIFSPNSPFCCQGRQGAQSFLRERPSNSRLVLAWGLFASARPLPQPS
jgi:hypothetical protein